MLPFQPSLPARIRVVGDVHGDSNAFRFAAATDRFVIQLGDLVDNGPDSAGVLRIMFDLIDEGRGLFLLGNHDFKLARVLAGQVSQPGQALAETLRQLDDGLRRRVAQEAARAGLAAAGRGVLRAWRIPPLDAGQSGPGSAVGAAAWAGFTRSLWGADRAHPGGWLSGAKPELGRDDTGRPDGLLRP